MRSTKLAENRNISLNLQTAKVFSILAVVIGHTIGDHFPFPFWVVVTVGLFIFSFSSGYFTYLKYNGTYSKRVFWKKKAERLAINWGVINSFLLSIFLVGNRSGISTWQSVINLLGLNGFLNWLHIENNSPFGLGLWFFTLLLLFYLCYPILEYVFRTKQLSYMFSLLFISGAFYLNQKLSYGHSLWLTSCGFIIGMFTARNDLRISKYVSGIISAIILILTIGINYIADIKQFDFFLVLFFCVFLIFFINSIEFPTSLITLTSYFSGCLLEIYLIHPYLNRKFVGHWPLDFLLSVSVILATAKILQWISSRLKQIFL